MLIVFFLIAARLPEDACKTPPLKKTGSLKQPSPFACDRLALTAELRRRHFQELGPMLRSMNTGIREVPNGYEFSFPSDPKTFALLAEWSAQESLCCPFFDIELRLERERGPVWLRLAGRKGTKEFIQADFAGWIRQ